MLHIYIQTSKQNNTIIIITPLLRHSPVPDFRLCAKCLILIIPLFVKTNIQAQVSCTWIQLINVVLQIKNILTSYRKVSLYFAKHSFLVESFKMAGKNQENKLLGKWKDWLSFIRLKTQRSFRSLKGLFYSSQCFLLC